MDPINTDAINLENLDTKCQKFVSDSSGIRAKEIKTLSLDFFKDFSHQANTANAENFPSLINACTTFISPIKK